MYGMVAVAVRASTVFVELLLLAKERLAASVPALVGVKITPNDTLCPAGMVTGSEIPAMANCPLLLDAEVTVTLPPVAVSDEVCVEEFPSTTEPKLTLGVTLKVPAVVVVLVPVPATGMFTNGPFTITLPAVMPAAWGVKLTVKVSVCPLESATAGGGSTTPKAPPTICSPETDCVHVQLLVRVTLSLDVVPTGTWPNERLAGLALSGSLLTPVPRTERPSLGFEALLLKLIHPSIHPVAVGVKVTLTGVLAPAARVSGIAEREILNAGPSTAIDVSSTGFVPVLVRITNWVSGVPSATDPNFMTLKEDASWAAAGDGAAAMKARSPSRIAGNVVRRDCG